MSENASDKGIRSLRLTLDVLEQVAAEGEIGVSELSVRLQSTKGTIYRHLQTLVSRGYVTQNSQNSRYRLGIRSFLLGQSAAARIDLLAASADAIKTLVDQVGQTVVLSNVGADRITVLHTALGNSSVEIGVRPGSELALHASSQGKVALAFAPHLTPGIRAAPLARFTEYTVVEPAVLEHELTLVRSRGWAIAPEELLLGLNGVAAPVFDGRRECVATLAIVGSIQYIKRNPDVAQPSAVMAAARQISNALGFPE